MTLVQRIVTPAPDWPQPAIHSILEELDFTPLAHELWQNYRLARLYASPAWAPPLSGLFPTGDLFAASDRLRAAQNAAPDLADAFRSFALLRQRPAQAPALARACAQIADWAAGRSLMISAVEFARAAAAVAPADPEFANLAALMLRRMGDWKRAEQFYSRAIGIARQKRRDPDVAVRRQAKIEYICGHIGTAALLCSQGIYVSRAVKHLHTAARVAAKGHIGWLAAHVRHDSMLLLLQRGDFTSAETEAARAADLYPLHDRRFPYFVTDFGLVQVMQHRYTVAIPLLQLALHVIHEPSVRGMISSMLARCHAALGQESECNRHKEWAVVLAEKHPELSPATHYHLAEAARACHSWNEAEQHARRALELAQARGDIEVVRHAERVLSETAARTVPQLSPPAGSGSLATTLALRLKRWNPENHRGRPARATFRNQWVA